MNQNAELAALVTLEFNIGKVKQREKSELSYFKGRIRELEKMVRQLQKELAYFKKHEHQFVEILDEIIEELPEEPIHKKETCPECARGTMEEFEIIGKVYATCNICGFRKKVK